ncbi:DUF402 domain-containing protein [Lysinibacillus sp. NPDC056185]|uniref:DUF402 domain-containing protein n=1 Tax=Lysinibacillus sp. NPDC056185 TaxID=3345739 RepID=UPI0039EE74D1
MLKRKYGDRAEWRRVIERKYSQSYLDTRDFKGFITLLKTTRVTEPLFVNYGEKKLCIVDNCYLWLQQFPHKKNHSVTTMFDANGEIIQWYIDICHKNSIEENVPYMDDLFLDLILLPSGEVIEKDADELEEAYLNGIIDKSLYDLAWNELNSIKRDLCKGEFKLVNLSKNHKDFLINESIS